MNTEELELFYDETNDDFDDREMEEDADHVRVFSEKQDRETLTEKIFAAKIFAVLTAAVATIFYICWMMYN